MKEKKSKYNEGGIMDKDQLKELIEETLEEIGLNSPDAVNLLLGTAAQESHMGEYIRQLGDGPAVGIFQMEPATWEDINLYYLNYNRQNLKMRIGAACEISHFRADAMRWNLKFAICYARLHYYRVSEPLPSSLAGYARYWKKYYNTILGAGTEDEFVANYERFVL